MIYTIIVENSILFFVIYSRSSSSSIRSSVVVYLQHKPTLNSILFLVFEDI